MSQLAQLLKDKAEQLRLTSETEVAVDMLKQAGLSDEQARLSVAQHVMEKEACSVLVQSGVDVEQAVAMVKAANVNVKDIAVPTQEYNPAVELLKQAAEYIEMIEAKNAELQDQLEQEIEKIAKDNTVSELPEPIQKAAKLGVLTAEDLAELENVHASTLEKIANQIEQPWDMGHAVGHARPVTDPLLEFILG